MNTSDESKLFQSDAQLAQKEAQARKAVLTKQIGDPIELGSRAIRLRVREQDAWVAESGWIVRRVCLKTGKTKRIYKGHQGPCTSLDFWDLPVSPAGSSTSTKTAVMFTGSWDKTIKAWNVETGELLCTTLAHKDFVKSVLVIPQLQILISGSSDKTISLWSLSSLFSSLTSSSSCEPLKRLALPLTSHTRPVDSFALGQPEGGSYGSEATIYSGDSLGSIKSWSISRLKDPSTGQFTEDDVKVEEGLGFGGHHTSITQLVLDGNNGLISSSVDSQVLYHPLPLSTPTSLNSSSSDRKINPKLGIPIPQPLYPESTSVRSLLLLPLSFHTSPLLLTGASDEDIRVHDISSTLDYCSRNYNAQDLQGGNGRGQELSRIKGHWADVMAMDIWIKEVEGGKREPWVVTAGLDQTIRRWSMQDVLHPPSIPEEEQKIVEENPMTEDEERELAELMGSDEE